MARITLSVLSEIEIGTSLILPRFCLMPKTIANMMLKINPARITHISSIVGLKSRKEIGNKITPIHIKIQKPIKVPSLNPIHNHAYIEEFLLCSIRR